MVGLAPDVQCGAVAARGRGVTLSIGEATGSNLRDVAGVGSARCPTPRVSRGQRGHLRLGCVVGLLGVSHLERSETCSAWTVLGLRVRTSGGCVAMPRVRQGVASADVVGMWIWRPACRFGCVHLHHRKSSSERGCVALRLLSGACLHGSHASDLWLPVSDHHGRAGDLFVCASDLRAQVGVFSRRSQVWKRRWGVLSGVSESRRGRVRRHGGLNTQHACDLRLSSRDCGGGSSHGNVPA